ncbi:MAG: PAS domain-containing protein, partial [Anaerolineales bacterium]|nr:PAS domain-containing protein [Anaerolineales bacterium]
MNQNHEALHSPTAISTRLFRHEFSELLQKFSPRRLLLASVLAIFVTEFVVMLAIEIVLQEPLPFRIHLWETIVDAAILAVVVFPMIYYLSFRPLHSSLQALNKSQDSLHASIYLLEKTFAGLGEVVFVMSGETHKILLANQSVTDVLGLLPEQMIGKRFADCFADPAQHQAWAQQVESRLTLENHVRLEAVLQTV